MTVIDEYVFETLYGKDIKGKTKTWKLKVERYLDYSVIVTLYGYNRMIETRRQINSGKNLGKVNMTSNYEQAISEAKSKWTKKRDIEKYTTQETNDLDLTNKINELQITNPLPMLAHDYQKHKNKVKYPVFCQPKLDGFRCIYNTTTKQITTRQGKEYSIVKQSGKLYKELQMLPKGLILDGELYTSKVSFETLGVLRKSKELTEEDSCNLEKIEYHIYDVINTQLVFEERNKQIKELFATENFEKLIYVQTYTVSNETEIKEHHSKFLEQGYEGLIIRNKHSLYKIKQRSSDLLKYKDFQDSEFEIIDFTLEKDTTGADENLIVWIVEIPIKIKDGKGFIKCKVRPMGTKEERKDLYKKCVENFDQFKGRKLWTKFFEYTRDGNLRFPTTLRNTYTEYIRDHIN
jgi:DNA ligase-1